MAPLSQYFHNFLTLLKFGEVNGKPTFSGTEISAEAALELKADKLTTEYYKEYLYGGADGTEIELTGDSYDNPYIAGSNGETRVILRKGITVHLFLPSGFADDSKYEVDTSSTDCYVFADQWQETNTWTVGYKLDGTPCQGHKWDYRQHPIYESYPGYPSGSAWVAADGIAILYKGMSGSRDAGFGNNLQLNISGRSLKDYRISEAEYLRIADVTEWWQWDVLVGPDGLSGIDGDFGLDSSGEVWIKTAGVWADSGYNLNGGTQYTDEMAVNAVNAEIPVTIEIYQVLATDAGKVHHVTAPTAEINFPADAVTGDIYKFRFSGNCGPTLYPGDRINGGIGDGDAVVASVFIGISMQAEDYAEYTHVGDQVFLCTRSNLPERQTHYGWNLEPAIGAKGSAFNKNFGTGADDVMPGDTPIPTQYTDEMARAAAPVSAGTNIGAVIALSSITLQ